MIDSSDHKDLSRSFIKNYFLPKTGIKPVILKLTDLPGKTVLQLTN